MELLTIDFDMTDKEISEWIDNWKVEKYGSDSLNPERYYNTSDNGRFLYGVKEGESFNDEKAECDRVLELLLRIRIINQKLSGKGLSRHLQYAEREQLKKERVGLYKEYLKLAQQPPQELSTIEAKTYFAKAIELGLMDSNYKWLKGLQMLACFAREMSIRLKMGKGVNSEGEPRISWKPFEILFNVEHGKLRLNLNDLQKTGQDPKEAYLIDKVFE